MNNNNYKSGNRLNNEKSKSSSMYNNDIKYANMEATMKDEDLIIEDNTIYEIDRNCYERLKKQKRRRT